MQRAYVVGIGLENLAVKLIRLAQPAGLLVGERLLENLLCGCGGQCNAI